VSRAASSRVGARLVLSAGALVLGPVLLAGPAHADSATPTPIASEPAGGATCLPGTSATCGQDVAPTPTPTTTTPAARPSATPAPTATETQVSSLAVDGGSSRHLARTGAGAAGGWGYAGTGLLLGGSVLVLAARRPRRAAR
jgi:hypothetical protein